VPDIFTSIAFDSGGVASGPMTACFLLPFSIGICSAMGNNVVTDAFGTVAMVAMTPLIAIQILGVAYKIKLKKAEATNVLEITEELHADTQIIDTPVGISMEDTMEFTTMSATYIDNEIIDF
jgi:hypothetical protein